MLCGPRTEKCSFRGASLEQLTDASKFECLSCSGEYLDKIFTANRKFFLSNLYGISILEFN